MQDPPPELDAAEADRGACGLLPLSRVFLRICILFFGVSRTKDARPQIGEGDQEVQQLEDELRLLERAPA